CQVINKVHPTVTLQKSWADAASGDTATLTIDGQPTEPAVVSTVGSTATFDDTTNVVTRPVTPGQTVHVAEMLDGSGYSSDLSCTGVDDLAYTDGELSGSFTMPNGNVECTFINSRT